ncbi:MAG TPA: hypothetical protein VF458_20100 [Ktedonobacteraceae bacterium]
MIYYRLASQKRQSTEWEWKSPVLNSLEAVFRMRQRYNAIPVESLRVFMASSVEYMDVLLVRENLGLSSNSLTMEQLLHDHSSITTSQVRVFEMELGWSENEAQVESREAVQVTGQEAEQEQRFSLVHVADHEPGGGDHDTPYTFTFPQFLPQMRAWMRLCERVQAGELLP